jgi:hypothetical protein
MYHFMELFDTFTFWFDIVNAVTWRYWPMESLDNDAERGLS